MNNTFSFTVTDTLVGVPPFALEQPAPIKQPGETKEMPISDIAQQLRAEAAAVRLAFTWLGARKSLSAEQKKEAAEPFNAQGTALSASKQLLDTRHPSFRKVTSVKGAARDYWTSTTLPYPEDGVRLIRRSDVASFDAKMRQFKDELRIAVAELEEKYSELKEIARTKLGTLYRDSDYPDTIADQFSIEWDFPSVEPPEYLMTLNPSLYETEKNRIAARFEQAIGDAEQLFAAELQKMVAHLADCLTPDEAGERKKFKDSSVTNLTNFFERFSKLSVRSNAQLDSLVEQAKKLVSGTNAKELRKDENLRADLATKMGEISKTISELVIVAPKRKLSIGEDEETQAEEPRSLAKEFAEANQE